MGFWNKRETGEAEVKPRNQILQVSETPSEKEKEKCNPSEREARNKFVEKYQVSDQDNPDKKKLKKAEKNDTDATDADPEKGQREREREMER